MVKFPVVPFSISLPVVPIKVPLFTKLPVTVKALIAPMFKVPPTFIVTLMTILVAESVTVAPVAIIAVSEVLGTTPPTHVEVVDQTPPVVVLVIVAAFKMETINNKITTKNVFVENNEPFLLKEESEKFSE